MQTLKCTFFSAKFHKNSFSSWVLGLQCSNYHCSVTSLQCCNVWSHCTVTVLQHDLFAVLLSVVQCFAMCYNVTVFDHHSVTTRNIALQCSRLCEDSVAWILSIPASSWWRDIKVMKVKIYFGKVKKYILVMKNILKRLWKWKFILDTTSANSLKIKPISKDMCLVRRQENYYESRIYVKHYYESNIYVTNTIREALWLSSEDL